MTSPLQPGDPERLGGYTIVSRLGQGGMGVTYLATDVRGVPVAVKTVLGRTADLLARFRHEAEITRQLDSPHVASVVEVGLDHDPPFLATRYIPGESLRRRVEREGPLPDRDLRELAAGLAGALSDLEAHGVVHRDLTPNNVLVGPEGPCVIDLGIALIEDATRLTQAGTAIGTIAWMAPEQLAGAKPGPWVDRWAAAAVLAYAATGRPPFGDGPSGAIAHRIESGRVDIDGVPGWLRCAIEPCFAVDPAARGRLVIGPARDPGAANGRTELATAPSASQTVDGPETEHRTLPYPPDLEPTSRHATHSPTRQQSDDRVPAGGSRGSWSVRVLVSLFLAAVTLVVGVFQEGLALIYVSIGLTIVALVFLAIGLTQRFRARATQGR